MKRIFYFLVSTVVLCIALTGCSSAPAESVRVGLLKGPTAIGAVKLIDDSRQGLTDNSYTFEIAGSPDELVPKIASNELDIAMVPANLAAAVYNNTNGNVAVIDINTLGVLYAVSADNTITGFEDLKGRTVYVTNKGSTPDYSFQYLLAQNGMTTDDITLEYKSEPTEVVALLNENKEAVGIIPQPFVTVATVQNEELTAVLDLTSEWDAVTTEENGRLVMGVTIVSREFLTNHEEAVINFMADHKSSCEYVNANPTEAANLVVGEGIIEKAPIAEAAIPKCNLTYIDKEEMKNALSGYLAVLYNQNATSVGGKLPGEDFYY